MLAVAIALGYMYQGPPFRSACLIPGSGPQTTSLLSPITDCSACGFHRLGYKGLGEPITFVTFGPLATSAFYLMHVSRLLAIVQPISLSDMMADWSLPVLNWQVCIWRSCRWLSAQCPHTGMVRFTYVSTASRRLLQIAGLRQHDCSVQVAEAGQAMLVSHSAAAASVVVGLTTASILFCSHFHQLATDKTAGKLSPIVRLGSTQRGLQVRLMAFDMTCCR